jgi:hypothetical protein
MPLSLPRFSLLPLFVVILLLPAGCLHRQTAPAVVAGELHGEISWVGEVFIGGDVTLAADARLTIRPGAVVRFLPPAGFAGGESDHPHFPGSELNVAGVLEAVGTPELPIVFAAAAARAPAGRWGAVNFAEGARGVLRYCVFRQADSAVHSREATVEVTESRFENNLVGIRFYTSDMRIERNLLRGNGAGIRFHFGSPVVSRNRFEENRVNLFITAHPRDYRIENNQFGTPLEYHVVLGEEVPETVLLSNNAWDGATVEVVAGRLFDGRRAAYLGTVEIEPLRVVPPGEAGPTWNR